MSNDQPTFTRGLGDDQPSVVTLDWEGDEVRWVGVDESWRDLVGPAGLIQQVTEAYQQVRPGRADWRLTISLADVELQDLREFTQLSREARASERAVATEPFVVRSGRIESHWSPRGELLGIEDPHQWISTAHCQALCEALTEALQRPAFPNEEPTPAVRRLLAFTGRKA